jgi:hypothetical protein
MVNLMKKNANGKTRNSAIWTVRRQTVRGRKSPPTATKAPANLDASVITEPLDSLISALGNKIEREWPARFANIHGARELFLLTVRIADVTSRSIRWLSAEKPPDPARIPEYCLSVPPLNRTILDNLFTVLFVLEDLPGRCEWYHKAAWREERLELDKYIAEYGHLAEWQEWLGRLKAHSDFGISFLGISPEEVVQPAKMRRWPNAGAMASYGLSPKATVPPGRAFMKYLDDWFYKDLSQQAHLGGTGLMKRASVFLCDRRDPERERTLKKNNYFWWGQTITLMLALASEVEAHFEFGLRERLRYLWGVTVPVIVVAKEVYDKRYATLLGQG